MDIKTELAQIFKGEIDIAEETLDFYSHDASLFELRPKAVVFPADTADVKAVVSYVAANKAAHPDLSITPRSAGTDMSGGAVGESIIMDVGRHMTAIHEMTAEAAYVQPGILYRNFDSESVKLGSILPSYPASRELASVGGMVENNSGGEKSLQYGKTDNFVTELSVVLSDGNEYVIKPLTVDELNAKRALDTFEGEIYRRTYDLLDTHYDEIQAAAPKVTKDSTGYHLWNVWNRDTGIFDLTKLFVGSQGTLGIVTDVRVRLVPKPEHSGTLVCYMRTLDELGDVIPAVLAHKPATFESFDDNTLLLSFKFFFAFLTKLGLWSWIKLALQLIPDGVMLIKGLPQLVLLIEFNGASVEEVRRKIHETKLDLERFNFSYMEEDETEAKSRKFWLMRRESFNLLRQKVRDKHTAPFIDDLVVPPARLTEFLPQLRQIIKKYNLLATIAGHMGDGNFHVIPLMKIEDPKERAKLEPAMKEVNTLVIQYGGSVSGEHNDGMVRGPWLSQMYSVPVLGYMREIKSLYDPQNIFNPHKKTDATWDFSFSHIRSQF